MRVCVAVGEKYSIIYPVEVSDNPIIYAARRR